VCLPPRNKKKIRGARSSTQRGCCEPTSLPGSQTPIGVQESAKSGSSDQGARRPKAHNQPQHDNGSRAKRRSAKRHQFTPPGRPTLPPIRDSAEPAPNTAKSSHPLYRCYMNPDHGCTTPRDHHHRSLPSLLSQPSTSRATATCAVCTPAPILVHKNGAQAPQRAVARGDELLLTPTLASRLSLRREDLQV